MISKVLELEGLRFSKALDELLEGFITERQEILRELQSRGILQSGLCREKVAEASLKLLRAKIDKKLELRKESIDSAPELAPPEHFRILEKAIHEIVEGDCLRIPVTAC